MIPGLSVLIYDQLWRLDGARVKIHNMLRTDGPPPDRLFICKLIGRTSREEAATRLLVKLGGQLALAHSAQL